MMGARGIMIGVCIGGMSACLAADPPVVRARYLMGTRCTASAYGDPAPAVRLVHESLEAIAGLEARISTWDRGSELSRANRAAGAGVAAIRPELAALLDRSLALARVTGGAFDPTVGALVAAWDLRGDGRVPDPEALARAREAVGFEKVRLDPDSGTLEYAVPGLWMELGGIGKGLALERAAVPLRAPDVSAALLDFGG
ncbi:MAG: FAD:protein FMN transferase, partial [Acidobacteriota bacterium]